MFLVAGRYWVSYREFKAALEPLVLLFVKGALSSPRYFLATLFHLKTSFRSQDN